MKIEILLTIITVIILSVLASVQGQKLERQQKLIDELDIKISELQIVVDQRVLPAMILDKASIGVR
tara:strand:- start:196 stop:393 length:198 start_codon:yes stop_codon:yes gene_type:complete